ncbi:uncharacterized protein LOC109806321 [Cajanus cajan]|uniref:uncharacterized protein LOC109806321 n=1 Tax=Cajanus cajan TaxID=3821 RepID=UPI0010FADA45|nr:uncharacterized protein LOC109806321 [Cajanus cajan]
MIKEISYGPSKFATSFNGLIVNGYRFHTKDYGHNKATMNSGVCVRGNIYGENDLDYYGIVEDILELSYLGHQRVIILRCHWFDPNGVTIDERYGLVDIKHKSKLQSDEPFVLAEQAQQVYYTRYPQSGGRSSDEWWAACKVRPKLFMAETLNDEFGGSNELTYTDYYQDDGSIRAHQSVIHDETIPLFDGIAPMEEVGNNDIHHPMENLHHDHFIDDI